MGRKAWLVPGGAALGLACALLAGPGADWEALSRPLLLLGERLRSLALTGTSGNLGAWAAVLLLSLLPLLLPAVERRSRGAEDMVPVLMVPLVFCLLYLLINPTLLSWPAREIFPFAALVTLLSLAVAWLILKMLRGLEGAPSKRMGRAFSALLVGGAALLAFSAAYGAAAGAFAQWQAVTESNTAPGTVTPLVLGVMALLNGTPGLLAALTMVWGGALAHVLGSASFGQEGVALCGRTAAACRVTAQATVLLAVMGNLLQLALLEQLRTVHFSLVLPLVSLSLSVGLFLLCRLLERGQALQADSDSII